MQIYDEINTNYIIIPINKIVSIYLFRLQILYTRKNIKDLMKSIGCFGGSNNVSRSKNKNQYEIYLDRKKQVKLPNNIQKYFSHLQQIYNIGFKKTLKLNQKLDVNKLTQNFYKIFGHLHKYEQAQYLMQLIIEVDRRIFDKQQVQLQRTLTVDTNDLNQTLNQNAKFIQQKCKYYVSAQTKLGFIKNWRDIMLKLSKRKKKLTIKHKNSLFNIPLRSYVLRKKQQERIFILQSVDQLQQGDFKKIIFQFQQNQQEIFNEFCKGIIDLIVSYQVDNLMMQNYFQQNFQKLDDPKKHRVYLHLTSNNIKKCTSKIEIYQKESKNQKSYFRTVLRQQYQKSQFIQITQFKNSQGTWYEGQIQIYDKHEPLVVNFLEIYQHSHKYLTKFNILETFVQNNLQNYSKGNINEVDKKYCAIYQKLKISQLVYGQEVFIQKIKNKQEEEQIFYLVNLDHGFNQNFLEFLKVLIGPAGKSQQNFLKIKLLAKFSDNFNNQIVSQPVLDFLKDFYTMFERLRASSVHQNQQIQINQINSKFYIQKDLISRFEQEQLTPAQFISKNGSPSSLNYFVKRLSVLDIPVNAYLRRKHKMLPTTQKIGKIMKQHFLYKQWERIPKGGLKCINYQLVQFQKSLYKTVMKKFGQHLIMGKNIINFSLPVVCFKKQSHLQSIGQSMCYCPIHLQKAAKIKDPLQRMKYSVVIMIAVGILTVQSQKPFNPILGQTYQGYVDGCPVYVQQISHHPPISAYFMQGRGFKMYGSVEPRISLHFNGATGYSNLPQFIQFDDGTVIELIFAKITITGMMFGDRQFFFEDKIYAFDKKNNMFTQLIFGPFKKGGLFSASSQPQDYFHGKIYNVSNEFKQKFNKSQPRIYPSKEDILKQLLMFDGIWSSSVHIDGQEIINFKTDLPYQFVQEQYPLPSDSRYRKDLQKLIEGDKVQAQKCKQEMEQQQRKDKKLRTQNQEK